MANLNKILIKAVQEDAKKGIVKVRVLSVPIKVKRKNGEDVHKLPAAYPIINEYEKEFKKDYSELMNKFFIQKFIGMLK